MTRWRYYRYLRRDMGHSHRQAWRIAGRYARERAVRR